MKPLVISFITFTCLSFVWVAFAEIELNFLDCISNHSPNSSSIISKIAFTPTNPLYLSVLNSSIHNLYFALPSTPKPLLVFTPLYYSHVQAAIQCSKIHKIHIRFRSGGHDYEGLSYVSNVPFVVIDLINFQSIEVDVESNTAWVESGATIGQLFYKIAEKSKTLAFPGGFCPTVGVGGHFSGGGYGMLLRKYGLAADNVVDVRMVDANGNILNRKTMGKDLFWAIRGGGGSFGVILAWKVNLVSVPPTFPIFSIRKTLEKNTTNLIHRWQYVAHKFPKELLVRIVIVRVNSTINVYFSSLYLGGVDEFLRVMQESFHELGLTREDISEKSWIESILAFENSSNKPPEILLNRTQHTTPYFKAKSDYVQEPIPISGLEGILNILISEDGADNSVMIFTPYGGIMDEISESTIPFPHRAGNLYMIQYVANWNNTSEVLATNRINWIRRLYSYMKPYVSNNPRAAYLNYRDLDIGRNKPGTTSYAQASVWGKKYFKNNFKRLVKVKSEVDPSNLFWNEQSIPALPKYD